MIEPVVPERPRFEAWLCRNAVEHPANHVRDVRPFANLSRILVNDYRRFGLGHVQLEILYSGRIYRGDLVTAFRDLIRRSRRLDRDPIPSRSLLRRKL